MTQFSQEFPEATTEHGRTKKRKDGSYNVRVRHDAEIIVTTTYCDHEDMETMTIDQLEGYLLVMGGLYNVSGYYNPHRPKVSYRFVNLKVAILKKNELCSCKKCVS
jgi:hypothetical protein